MADELNITDEVVRHAVRKAEAQDMRRAHRLARDLHGVGTVEPFGDATGERREPFHDRGGPPLAHHLHSDRGHLHGESMFASKCANILLIREKRQTQFLRSAFDKPLVRIAAAAAELVIEVSHRKPPAVSRGQARQQMQQDHGIQSARHGHQNGLTTVKQPPGKNGFLNPVKQVTHANMVK